MFFGTETHLAVQPETETQNLVGGAEREAAPSCTEPHASLGAALGVKKVSGDPESRCSLKAAGKTGAELLLNFLLCDYAVFRCT